MIKSDCGEALFIVSLYIFYAKKCIAVIMSSLLNAIRNVDVYAIPGRAFFYTRLLCLYEFIQCPVIFTREFIEIIYIDEGKSYALIQDVSNTIELTKIFFYLV